MVMLVLCLAGCEAIFTYTPLTSLQRSPSSLPPEQRLAYAQNALASGDIATMTAALAAIEGDPSAEAQYTAAELGIEVSGMPKLLLEAVNGTITIDPGNPSTITTFLHDNPDVQPDFLIAAAARLNSADPATLTPMDYVYGSLGLALDAAKQTDGSYDFTPAKLDAPKAGVAQIFIDEAKAALDPADPMQAYLTALKTYVP
jgi:hypothetical protein